MTKLGLVSRYQALLGNVFGLKLCFTVGHTLAKQSFENRRYQAELGNEK
jgi:hypothetical protein